MLFGVVTLAGCAKQVVVRPNPVDVGAASYDRYFLAAEQVLDEQGLILDRQDHRFGVITVQPQPLATVMEPWAGQHQTIGEAVRATVNDERRLTTVNLERGDSSAARLRVEAVIERLELPDRFLTGSTRGHRIFAAYTRTPSEWRRRGIVTAYWLPVGRDEPYEQMLLAKIMERADKLLQEALPPDLTQPPPLEALPTTTPAPTKSPAPKSTTTPES